MDDDVYQRVEHSLYYRLWDTMLDRFPGPLSEWAQNMVWSQLRADLKRGAT